KEANEEAETLRKEFAQETKNLVIQEGAAKTSSTNIFSIVSTPAKASSTNLVNIVSIPVSTASPHVGLSRSDTTCEVGHDVHVGSLIDEGNHMLKFPYAARYFEIPSDVLLLCYVFLENRIISRSSGNMRQAKNHVLLLLLRFQMF
ncbi:hypothetical protein Tco_1565884, partial [Tanacetum coccineum]